jgi:hypothetical protein
MQTHEQMLLWSGRTVSRARRNHPPDPPDPLDPYELLLSRPTLVRFGTLGELTLGSSSATADRPLRWMRHRNGCAR